MEKDKIIHFGLSSIDELSFEQLWSDELSQSIDKERLQVKFFTQTFINNVENCIKIKGGISYFIDEKQLFRLETLFRFEVDDLAEAVTVDEEKSQINFRTDMAITMVSSVIGAMRGMLFVKTLGTELSNYPLPLISMDIIMKKNTFVIEQKDEKK